MWLRRAVARGLGAVLVASTVVLVTASVADAHTCAKPVNVVEGRSTAVTVAVGQGDEVSSDIRLEFADGIVVDEVPVTRGWTASQEGPTVVRFTGGQSEANGCIDFTVRLHATRPGSYAMRAFERLPSGATVEHPAPGDLLVQPDGSAVAVDYDTNPPNPLFEQVITATPSKDANTGRTVFIVMSIVAALVVIAAFVVPVSSRGRGSGSRRRTAAAARPR